jgi:hypothetical protein
MATIMPPKLALVPALGVVIVQSCFWGARGRAMSAWYGPARPPLLRQPGEASGIGVRRRGAGAAENLRARP